MRYIFMYIYKKKVQSTPKHHDDVLAMGSRRASHKRKQNIRTLVLPQARLARRNRTNIHITLKTAFTLKQFPKHFCVLAICLRFCDILLTFS